MRLSGSLLIGLMLPLVGPAALADPAPITTGSLVAEMADLERLAEWPDPPFTCRQFSSYDRRSVWPRDAKGWFANGDSGHYLRQEQRDGRTERVMVDVAGPGAIVRIWSANPDGTLRVYLDGSERPALEAPMAALLGGEWPGAPEPITGRRARGWNSYLPIPYARHCKITADGKPFYYHVNYRTYPPGTPVETFKADDLVRYGSQIAEAARRLEQRAPTSWAVNGEPIDAPNDEQVDAPDDQQVDAPGGQPAGAPGDRPADAPGDQAAGAPGDEQVNASAGRQDERLELNVTVGPGETVELAELSGPRAIRALTLRPQPGTPAALRRVVLAIEFDGEPCVEVPLGDFFGGGQGAPPYRSLPLEIDAQGGLHSRWFMPFERSARLTLRSAHDEPVELTGRITSAPYAWTQRSMHLHAGWRAAYDIPSRPQRDWNYAGLIGRGVLVGTALSFANPVKGWWGEGDEKIYVDCEVLPSHFGTGTEDYFGYAWCSPEVFSHAYHNQPRCDGPRNYGVTCVNRWHVMDRIPFTTSLRFDMELWHWVEGIDVSQSVVVYWYARPGGRDEFAAIAPADLRVVELPPYEPPRVAGAIEGEQMRVIERDGVAAQQAIDGCSNDHHLWWRKNPGVGARLTLGFAVETGGQYRVVGRFVQAPDYGVVRLALGDGAFGEPIDLYHERVKVSDEIDLGVHPLTAGENVLRVEVVGANPAAIKAHMFGLDYLRLEAPIGATE